MRRVALAASLLMLVSASSAASQPRTRLVLTGFTGAFGNTLLTDFDQGFKQSAAMVYTISITRDDAARTATLLVRSNSATLGATKPIAHLQWRLSSSAIWVPLTTSDVAIDSQPLAVNGDFFTDSIIWRVLLDWGTDALGAISATLTFTLQIAAP